ncbi:MAG: hypothetical protein AAF490_02155 [Chloroflexota bacterium]
MDEFAGIKVENAAVMTEMERLEAAFLYITNYSIEQIEKEFEVAKAMDDKDKVKLFHIQMGMFKHAQGIFAAAKNYATNERWNNE